MPQSYAAERKLCLWLGIALAAALIAPAPSAALPAFIPAPADLQSGPGSTTQFSNPMESPAPVGLEDGYLVKNRYADHAGSDRPGLLHNGLPGGPAVPIPEPASLILMGGALMVLRQLSAKLQSVSPSKELN